MVPHRSTNRARCCLTSLSGREAVLSTWYGRVCKHDSMHNTYTYKTNKQQKPHNNNHAKSISIAQLIRTDGGRVRNMTEEHAAEHIKRTQNIFYIQQHQHNKLERQHNSTTTHQKHARAYMCLHLIEGYQTHQEETDRP